MVAAIGEPNIAAGFGQSKGHGLPDAAAAAYDQRNVTFRFRQISLAANRAKLNAEEVSNHFLAGSVPCRFGSAKFAGCTLRHLLKARDRCSIGPKTK